MVGGEVHCHNGDCPEALTNLTVLFEESARCACVAIEDHDHKHLKPSENNFFKVEAQVHDHLPVIALALNETERN